MFHCPCGTILKRSSYRHHRYRNLQHVDYNIALCIERDLEIDAWEEEILILQRGEVDERVSLRAAEAAASSDDDISDVD